MATNNTQIGTGNKINNSRTKITISIGTVFIFAIVIVIAVYIHGNNSFSIEGKWKNTGTEGYGMSQPGAIVSFNGEHCNFYSPSDTYTFYKDESGNNLLELSGLLGDSSSFKVEIIDKNHIKVLAGSTTIELTRVG